LKDEDFTIMQLEDLGYTDFLENYRKEHHLTSFEVGRVITEHKDRYMVKSAEGEFDAELLGKLRFNAESRADLPAVGDWVAIAPYDDDKALIHAIYPRHSVLARQAAGKTNQKQIIATNIDYGLIVLSVNRDFNINRVERYLTICHASKVAPIVVLSKIDLIAPEVLDDLILQVRKRVKAIPVLAMSNQSQAGIEALKGQIQKGKTYCLLGSSGVGKSTLLNTLMGETKMETGEISQSIDRGKHVTSHRELTVLEGGGIMIDNPGMREVGITNSSTGLEITFDDILELAEQCRFNDCTHTNEIGCAILEALDEGNLDTEAYDNFQKMERERERLDVSEHERRRKRKTMSKLIRRVVKNKNKDNYS
jgi:ribosome biogenesis GTPase